MGSFNVNLTSDLFEQSINVKYLAVIKLLTLLQVQSILGQRYPKCKHLCGVFEKQTNLEKKKTRTHSRSLAGERTEEADSPLC